VAVDGDVVASWRPRTASRKLVVLVDPWRRLSSTTRSAIAAEAERLASFRGVTLAGVEFA